MRGTMNEIEDNLVQQEADWRESVMRRADAEDRERLAKFGEELKQWSADCERERVLALGKEMDIPIPGTTTVSLDLDELTRLRGGFVRANNADERLYLKLKRAEARLTERLAQ